ncbi:hypothetical protein [Flavobacterium aquidurense]|uniref:hypothetical protein n=1 Tax=Flavobacterium aquidurense TaxID=362413 RepID=UPI0037243829
MKDIEKDLIKNAPLKGSQTDIDTHKSNEAQNDSFETIDPEKDNSARREFEIGALRNEELKEDEIIRNASGQGAIRIAKPSQRKF